MDNALMVGLSRQITLRRAVDVTANNVANASTAGFKAERVLLEANGTNRARHADGPSQLHFADEWGLGRDFAQGALDHTGRPLDLAIQGDGFFVLETDAGERYTRDGRFTMSPEGELVAADGARVLDEAGQPILIDPAAGPVTISEEGAITQDGVALGRVGVVEFDNRGALEKRGQNRFSAPENAEPAPAAAAVVRQGYTESSNVSAISEITRMIEVSGAYQSVTKMIQQTEELSRQAIERLGRP
jgi:flagellar basal-body rod protein FlgF